MSNIKVLVAIVYDDRDGRTTEQAQAVAIGASSHPQANSLLISVDEIDCHWDTLEDSDAIIFACPTCMGSASGPFKTFMDASASRAFDQSKWRDKVAAGFTHASARSGHTLNTLVQLWIFAAQQGMHWVNLGPLPCHDGSLTRDASVCLHSDFLGVAAPETPRADVDAEIDVNADATPVRPSEWVASEHLGRRVARVAYQLATGRALGDGL